MSRKQKTARGSLVELVVIVAVALGLALGIQAFLVKPYRIPSESMLPTLKVDQRVLVNRIGNNFSDPEIGEIMVFHPPVGAEEGNRCGVDVGPNEICPKPTPEKADVNFIKRVVAGPGDTLRIQQGHAIVNGEPLDEPWAQPCDDANEGCTFSGEITIPEDHWFMMGDNRDQSADSRFWGPVPRDWFIGGAFATYWPPSEIGLL